MGGWELESFNRYFYPPKRSKQFRKLEFYSQFFDCMEVNATFYNTSFTPTHASQWLRDVEANDAFLFTVKLYKGFTHTYAATREDIASVHRILEVLERGNKLGGMLVQFPTSFTNLPERRHYLARLGAAFRPYRLFVEVRHASWNSPVMEKFFTEHDLYPVNVDLPRLRQHMPLTTAARNGVSYFRMMGRNAAAWASPWRTEPDGKHMVSDRYKYIYSVHELERLALVIERMKSVSDTTFVVFHNDPEANSLVNGFQLRHLLERNRHVAVPGNFARTFPALEGIGKAGQPLLPLFVEGARV